jgi:murein DD-endopeptidase MepM/ murein hydrolase activator NlpD
VKELKNSIIRKIITVIYEFRQKLTPKMMLGFVVGFLFLICTIYVSVQKNSIYMVKVNDKQIGYVNNKKLYSNVLKSIKSTDGEKPLESITIEKAKYTGTNFVDSLQIEKEIRRELKLKMKAAAILINGEEAAKIEKAEDLNKVIEEVKQYYYPKIQSGTISVVSSSIKEDITTTSIMTDSDDILDIHDAAQKIINGKGSEKIYVVKQGDTIWDIALKNDISIEEIKAANPNLNVEKIGIDDEIKFAKIVPFVNVEVVADVSSEEQIPYNTKTIMDKNLANGTKKVQQQGKNGLVQVKKHLTIVNNEVVSEDVLESKTIASAVDEVIVKGNKTPQYVATGSFIRPSRGSLTSRFGSRWGRKHEGIDIGAPTGTPIVAADAGKVIFSGTRNGYGKCVVISHGNGVQTLYGHASKLFVKSGQSVKKGEKIAAVGSTGRSTGPHLHFEVIKNGVSKNPLNYIK